MRRSQSKGGPPWIWLQNDLSGYVLVTVVISVIQRSVKMPILNPLGLNWWADQRRMIDKATIIVQQKNAVIKCGFDCRER